MARKKKDDNIVFSEQILQKTMEEVLHDSMLPYSEYVILERALPRVEDGLKPVQRRILFTMLELGITADKPHRKCARIVGDCLGKYHPHGDTSVYDALARMAQPFVMRAPLVDGHGNFGSVDGDSPAAMRYTEARMTELAAQLLRDIDKDTVGFHLNFDDSQKEPDVLPGRFPNLLVNGASGIAVGLATNIPPHNLGETIDAAIAQIDNPAITVPALMEHLKAPDFPTGGILAADGELLQAYETGRGKLQVRAKLHVEDGASGRKLIVITELPYQVNKAALLERILRVSEERKALFSGIYDIRDESDRTGMRAVVELRREADPERMIHALYRYSDLQVTFGVNIVAIAGGKPLQMGIKDILHHFIVHQKNVVTRRTKHDLEHARARAHILEGLIVAVDNLDETIALIRASKSPREARDRLMERFDLSEIQAQAILDMRLQRLTNLEILSLRKEYAQIERLIADLEAILKSEKRLMRVIKSELTEIREKFADERRTQIVPSFKTIAIEEEAPVADEAAVVFTRTGFIKRMPPRALGKAEQAEDAIQTIYALTDEKILFFTNLGNCYSVTISQIPECRPRDRGLAPGGLLAGLEKDEAIVTVLQAGDYAGDLLFVTRGGLVKRTPKKEYDVRKTKIIAARLKEGDQIIAVLEPGDCAGILLLTEAGMAIHFAMSEVSTMGRNAAGVKGIALAPEDGVVAAFAHDGEGEIVMASELGYLKRCIIIDFDRQARSGKGLKAFHFTKDGAKGTRIADAMMVTDPYAFDICQKSGAATRLNTEEVEIQSRSGSGKPYVVVVMDDTVEALRRV
ncbi:MAG: DNA gyrase/topoisomerase IV subunit A [Christensenellales bacterium]|jgi:DNA gyrase subunit A